MSCRQLEEQMEFEGSEQLASILGLSIDELQELDYQISPNESNDGLIYEYVVTFEDSSPQNILDKIDGLCSGNCVYLQPYELESDPYEEELIWDILSSEQFDNFILNIESAKQLNNNQNDNFQTFVMLHAHIVASIEAFLSSSFIHSVTNNDALIRKVIETTPHFKEQTISLSEVYSKQDNIQNIVGDYLKGIIFHKIKIAASLYKSVLNIDLGEIKWLTNAIAIRHHCTHRAGYDKQGKKVDVTQYSIDELITKSLSFCERINSAVIASTKL
jgi:hypothetical protein